MPRKTFPKASTGPSPSTSASVHLHPSSPPGAASPAPVKFSGEKLPRPHLGIQVNVCKNPDCLNYGVWPSYRRRGRKTPLPPAVGDYSIIGKSQGFEKTLKCGLCGEYSTLRSNKAVYDEITRISSYLSDRHEVITCPNESCTEHGICATGSESTQTLCGSTSAGTKRYRCSVCRKVYTVGRIARNKSSQSYKLREIFSLIVNQTSVRRATEIADISPLVYYRALKFLYEQCRAFVGNRESQLLKPDSDRPKKLYLSVDRQSYTLNWVTSRDRQNVIMNAVASVDQHTRYGFGLTLNFDGNVDAVALEREAEALDVYLPNPWRSEARLKLMVDYNRAAENSNARKQAKAEFEKVASLKDKGPELRLISEVAEMYVDTMVREDVENKALTEVFQQPPPYGMQVFDQYTMIAHFNVLNRLTQHFQKIRYFADQDSGMRSAFLQAFSERVKNRTAELFYVKIDKSLTAKGKLNASQKIKKKIEDYAASSRLTLEQAELELMKQEIRDGTVTGPFKDTWVHHACPHKGEPYKQVAWLTKHNLFDEEHVAHLFLKATLAPVDTLFNLTRRRLAAAERSFVSPSAKRTWEANALYNPQNLVMLLEILRTYYNYCKPGLDKKTPAQLMGLAKGPVDLSDIIYYSPANPTDSKLRKRKRSDPSGV